MQLSNIIQEALDLTLELSNVLESGDLDKCNDLILARSLVMEKFESIHRQANVADKQSCQQMVVELISRDKAMQSAAKLSMNAARGALNSNIGSISSSQSSAYQTHPQQACVDRKA